MRSKENLYFVVLVHPFQFAIHSIQDGMFRYQTRIIKYNQLTLKSLKLNINRCALRMYILIDIIFLFLFTASSGQYAHYVFNSLDPHRNGSLSFEVSFSEAHSRIPAHPSQSQLHGMLWTLTLCGILQCRCCENVKLPFRIHYPRHCLSPARKMFTQKGDADGSVWVRGWQQKRYIYNDVVFISVIIY